ncbi:MAG TPA: folylpolyglutamate synthase/dihydrofolate synthase family protein [Solirubrobacteraceae bacterium]|nr:folylpolyglutamate synthase/dihydrofolate synthase family protein [Solirubrobacteraceae bacterium]
MTRAHPLPAHPFTPEEAERYVLSLERFGMRFELDRMRRLMTALGHPERAFASIHVVGTNGKSSTTRMIASILRHHGLRTGTYLSPHLVSFGERIRIGDRDLTATEFAAAITRAARAADLVNRALDADDRVTQFEVLTAAAYSEMARQEVQCAVIEAGLGGRYDATNVIPSTVQVLTSVGLEHTRWLGPTLTDIAREKLDVVQPSGTLILGSGLAPEVLAVAERVCSERGARILHAPTDPGVPVVRAAGQYQRRNFALARTAAEIYLGALDDPAVAAAAAEVRVPGRLEQIDSDPLTVLDVAHNPEGMRALTESLPDLAAGRSPVVAVVSVLDDKDAAGMLTELMPACDRLVLTTTQNPRVLPPATLKSLATQLNGPPTEVVGDPWRALARARELAGHDGFVVVTGSQYLVGDLLAGGRRARVSSL